MNKLPGHTVEISRVSHCVALTFPLLFPSLHTPHLHTLTSSPHTGHHSETESDSHNWHDWPCTSPWPPQDTWLCLQKAGWSHYTLAGKNTM